MMTKTKSCSLAWLITKGRVINPSHKIETRFIRELYTATQTNSINPEHQPAIMSTTIAVWSNKGADVRFVRGQEAVIIRYGREEATNTLIPGVMVVEYDPGSHRNTLRKLRKDSLDLAGEEGIYFQKHKRRWVKVGTIAWATVPDTGKVRLFLVNAVPTQLATNKTDALRTIGYTKKMGKGGGNFMTGLCRIVPLS